MKKIIFLVILNFLTVGHIKALDKVIYGRDDLRFVGQLSEPFLENISKSVLAQVPKSQRIYSITNDGKDYMDFVIYRPSEVYNFCIDEVHYQTPMLSSCTGFLVGEDMLMTAGHCVLDETDCKSKYWVTSYTMENAYTAFEGKAVRIFNKNIYECKSIISKNYNRRTGEDYALIELDRKIKDREILKVRRKGKMKANADLGVIGFPLGFPEMVDDNILIKNQNDPYSFTINADTFTGNSGSPVVNLETGIVEGMLIKGEKDFDFDVENSCTRPKQCNSFNCKGETVIRSTLLPI